MGSDAVGRAERDEMNAAHQLAVRCPRDKVRQSCGGGNCRCCVGSRCGCAAWCGGGRVVRARRRGEERGGEDAGGRGGGARTQGWEGGSEGPGGALHVLASGIANG